MISLLGISKGFVELSSIQSHQLRCARYERMGFAAKLLPKGNVYMLLKSNYFIVIRGEVV